MRITLVYDNDLSTDGLKNDWGLSLLIEREGVPRMLFDTGANGRTLLFNLARLDISPRSIQDVFLSHSHWDHTGGLADLFEKNPDFNLYMPPDFIPPIEMKKVRKLTEPVHIHDGFYSTGWIGNVEQSLLIRTDRGIVVLTGCSHCGVENILEEASRLGDVYGLIGGLHGFRDFSVLKDLAMICACHCTDHKSEIKSLFPEKWIDGGAGRVIAL